MQSFKEENYLKAIYQLKIGDQKEVVTITDISVQLGLKTPTVLEKIKSMAIKKLISYDKICGVQLTKNGFDVAVNIVRRHRIWETYLYKELKFSWSEVHEIAEQLEHVNSAKLIEKIYAISNNESLTLTDQFEDFCNKINIPLQEKTMNDVFIELIY